MSLFPRSRAGGWLGLCVAVALGLLWQAAGCRSAPRLTAQEAEGKRLYQGRCAHCHEENDLGLKKPPPNLHGVFDRSTLPSGATATDAEVQHVLVAGKGSMPSFDGRFSADQMQALLAYLHTGLR
jgi:mono/diheme cytochrome c family protein